ncbi:hypothetical protein FGW37_05250 [Streptomyces rectiverticillatus]|uniref:hypothetical protein n=1 Tax=Streptomyces rectiverticillatus TaxID=173860 RepID=UPI0015C2F91A|nr:hypothetical protein [Streptomyces rectiverticillatus]QLE71087.1 hypothetical protein FGW37_05250 [Streptomyces rectiverticillatus]
MDEFEEIMNNLKDQISANVINEAAEIAKSIVRHAAAVRALAIESGLSPDLAEGMAADFWRLASGAGELE